MDSIISTFQLDLKLFIAQLINFGIVFAVLYFFAFKPLVKIMTERTKTIEKSLDNAKKIEERIGQTEEDYKKIISQGKKEANEIIEKAMEQAEKKKREMIDKTKEEIGGIINEEKAKMQAEKGMVLKEIKSEVTDLVIAAMEKVLEQKMSDKEDKELIKKVLKK
jgi:F-type H+-transporting ATPase subunit b